MLLVSAKNFGLGRLRGPVLPDITDHADDCHRVRRVKAPMDQVADGILTVKCILRQLFVDDGGEGRVIGVAVVEVASLEQWNSKSRKRTWRDDGKNRIDGRIRKQCGFRRMVDPIASAGCNVPGQGPCRTNIEHARYARKLRY